MQLIDGKPYTSTWTELEGDIEMPSSHAFSLQIRKLRHKAGLSSMQLN